VPVPPLLRQVIAGRVAHLGAEAQRLLAVAAVVGQEVPLFLWASVAAIDEEGLLDTVERATKARLLTEVPEGTAVRFAHALVREALYEGTLAARRRRLHRAVAEALLAAPDSDPDAVASHLQRAGDPRAAGWLIRAGERARLAYAWVSAAERYEAALALQDGDVLPTGERARLLLTLANLRRYAAPARGVALAEEAARLAEAAGDPILAAAARFDCGNLRGLAGATRTGAAEMEAAWPALADLTPPERARLPVVVVLGSAPAWDHHRAQLVLYLAAAGRYRDALALGVPFLQRAPATSPRGLQGLGYTQAMLGQPEDCWSSYADARAGFAAIGQHREVFHTFGQELEWSLRYRADQPEVLARLADGAALALTRASGAHPGASDRLSDVALLWLAGRWAEGRALVLAAREADRATRMLFARPWLGRILRAQGDAAAAWAVVREGLPGGPAAELNTELPQALALQQLAAALALDEGDRDTARAWLRAHDAALTRSGAMLGRAEGALGWAAYHRVAGDLTQAREHAEAALARATEPHQPLALLAAHRLLGELATDAGRHADPGTHLDAALALAEACAAPYERALTLLALAERHAAAGAREQAGTAFAQARALLEPMGAAPALARAEALAARLAIPPPATPAALPFGLTAREADVLRLLAEGLTDPQIAARLFVSRNTVNAHTRAIYGKLGVNTRAAAARLAAERGLR
jgi:DNA-binding CsgD family transcriptional regulator